MKQLDPMDIAARVDDLSELKDGWLEGNGKSLNRRHLDHLVALFDAYYANDLVRPYLYPTTEGGIQAEWSIDHWEVTLEIRLDTMAAQYQAYHLESGVTHEELMDLNSDLA